MEKQIRDYFRAEKQESLLFIALGLLALGFGLAGLLYFKQPIWTGAAIPLIAIALIQLVVGGSIFFRTDRQTTNLLEQLEQEPERLVQEEIPRMEKVIDNFRIYRYVELALFLLGFFFVLIGGLGKMSALVFGSGIGLSLQSGLMLILDLFAEWRAGLYSHKLDQFRRRGLHT